MSRSIGFASDWALVTDMLADRHARAHSFGLHSVLEMPFPAAVKTGTSSDFHDTWTIGFTRDYTVGVWGRQLRRQPDARRLRRDRRGTALESDHAPLVRAQCRTAGFCDAGRLLAKIDLRDDRSHRRACRRRLRGRRTGVGSAAATFPRCARARKRRRCASSFRPMAIRSCSTPQPTPCRNASSSFCCARTTRALRCAGALTVPQSPSMQPGMRSGRYAWERGKSKRPTANGGSALAFASCRPRSPAPALLSQKAVFDCSPPRYWARLRVAATGYVSPLTVFVGLPPAG